MQQQPPMPSRRKASSSSTKFTTRPGVRRSSFLRTTKATRSTSDNADDLAVFYPIGSAIDSNCKIRTILSHPISPKNRVCVFDESYPYETLNLSPKDKCHLLTFGARPLTVLTVALATQLLYFAPSTSTI